MLIVMDKKATQEQIDAVIAAIEQRGFTARPIPGGERMSIGILNNKGHVDDSPFLGMPGVKDAIHVTRPYKLVSREFKPEDTVVRVGEVSVGSSNLTIIAGPCAVESEYQALTIAEHVRRSGAQLFRGGAFKPRTSPYSFQGLGEKGLKILAKVRRETGMPVVTEVMDLEKIDLVAEYADVIQIGTRNMQNFSLLRRAGKASKPVLLKRGMAATIDEWLMAAEYIMEGGNSQVILCERGVRTFVHHSRNTLDLSAVSVVIKESHLPIIVDPSHAAGQRDQVHHAPEEALSDGAQSLYPDQFEKMCRQVRSIYNELREPEMADDR
jgi:3-deoxy-7-phosphoheptulonate synthase